MLIAQLFLVVSISVATADIIVDSSVQNLTTAPQVDCDGKVCKNFATCIFGNTCDCRRGTKGDACEIVAGCEKLKEKCDKINSECIYDPDLEQGVCKCHNEKEKFNGESCVECECGEFGTRCVFLSGIKYCFCKKGYSEDDGTCSLCTCGNHTVSCAFTRGDKYCVCDEGYQFKLGTCEECDCGENSTSCKFDKADKVCTCKNETKDRLGICTTCECGPDAVCKFTSTGDKKCDCIGPLCHKPGTPWNKNNVVIVGIVLSVGIIIFGIALAAYRKLRSNRRGY